MQRRAVEYMPGVNAVRAIRIYRLTIKTIKRKQPDLLHTLKSCITFLSQDGQRGAILHGWPGYAKALVVDICPCKPSRSVVIGLAVNAYLIYAYRRNPLNFVANIMSDFRFAFQLKGIPFIGMMLSR
uniref:Uncharacterized protein n=1 Tax=Glossina austeni TaxID=7395 RepID=A0A1A9VMH8_GLOAU